MYTEIKSIIQAYEDLDQSSVQAALATVILVEGSSYRRTGARMLVLDNGIWVGGISGGCLEGDALKRARMAINNAKPSVITYDTTQKDDHQIGIGLGCEGIIRVLFTPLNFSDPRNPVEMLKHCARNNHDTHVLITITGLLGIWPQLEEGKVILYNDHSDLDYFLEPHLKVRMETWIQDQIKLNRSAPETFVLDEGVSLSVFLEIIPPDTHLVVMGFQYDVYPLVRLAHELDWRIDLVAPKNKVNHKIHTLIDQVYEPENFPDIPIDRYTAIVLMAHDYKLDKLNLSRALKTHSPYIGMLGPRVRALKIFKELAEEGEALTDRDFTRIFAPAGLDIGALAPEEIALSLIAEIKTCLSNREGGFLRLRQTPIHER